MFSRQSRAVKSALIDCVFAEQMGVQFCWFLPFFTATFYQRSQSSFRTGQFYVHRPVSECGPTYLLSTYLHAEVQYLVLPVKTVQMWSMCRLYALNEEAAQNYNFYIFMNYGCFNFLGFYVIVNILQVTDWSLEHTISNHPRSSSSSTDH